MGRDRAKPGWRTVSTRSGFHDGELSFPTNRMFDEFGVAKFGEARSEVGEEVELESISRSSKAPASAMRLRSKAVSTV